MKHLEQLAGKLPKRAYLAAGLLVRLFLAPFLSHPFDMRVFMAVGAAVANGITPYGQYFLRDIFAATPHPHLYGTVPGIGYPPLWGLISGEMYSLSSAIAPNNLYAYVLALKIPIILAEIATALLIYNILKTRTSEKTASKAFLLFLFCPFIISVGTVWGMFDILALFFALFSAYTLRNNWKLSSTCLSVASLLKLFPLTLAPLYSVILYKSSRNWKVALKFSSLAVGLTVFLTFLPMIVFNWPISNMYNALIYHVETANPSYYSQTAFPYGAASPFNVFTLINNLGAKDFQPPSAMIYVWIPACIAIYALASRSRKLAFGKDIGGSNSYFALTVQWSLLLLLTLFTTRMWVSEQNLTFLFTFLALSVFIQNPKDLGRVHTLWLLLFSFVLVHVPVTAFLWLPYPWTLNVATSFADGPLGWTRLLLMTVLTFSWLALSWDYVIRKLRWRP
jgi:hypothetical protein